MALVNAKIIAVCVLVAGCGVALDVNTPLGVAVGIVYVALVLLAMFHPWSGSVLVAAAGATVLIGVGYALSPDTEVLRAAAFNRALSVAIVWTVAAFVYVRQRDARALSRYATDLERSNAELEQFAYVASHDLQEPLRMVSSFTELLAEDYGPQLDDTARDYIDYAVDGANRMQRLIQDLLEYSRVNSRHKPATTVDTRAAIDDAMQNLQAAIDESEAQISVGELPALKCDRHRLVQLFQNLLSNAIKFRNPEVAPSIRVAGRRREGYGEITISDNGIGIDTQYADRIFRVFQRLHTRDQYPGTGIGLALCKRITERYGGSIRLSEHEGDGTTITFTLPLG